MSKYIFNSKVLLVSSPSDFISLPSIALGSLKSLLDQAGVSCNIWESNLVFAQLFGYENYVKVQSTYFRMLPWERIFAHFLFDSNALPSDSEYIRAMIQIHGDNNLLTEESLTELLIKAKSSADVFFKDLKSYYDLSSVKVVGFSTTFGLIPALSIAKHIKEEYPEMKVILGGAYCNDEMGLALLNRFPFTDVVFHGEADNLLVNVVKDLLVGKAPEGYDAISFRKEGKVVSAKTFVSIVLSLEELPLPDYSSFFERYAEYFPDYMEYLRLPYEASRGCWYGKNRKCLFCGFNFNHIHFRSKSAKKVLNEIVALNEKYQVKNIKLVDNILDRSYFKDLLPLLSQTASLDGRVLWWQVKSNLTNEQIRALSEAHITQTQPGIESLSSEVLKLMNKGVSALQNIQFLKFARQSQVRVFWNIIYGFPGEEPRFYDRMLEWFPFLTHLMPPSSYNTPYLQRSSPLYEKILSEHLAEIKPFEAYRFIYPLELYQDQDIIFFFTSDMDFDKRLRLTWEKLRANIRHWQSLWRKSDRGGVLLSNEQNGRLEIVDTRPGRKINKGYLTGMERKIFNYCARIRRRSQIDAFVDELGMDISTISVDALLSDWVEKGWLIREEDSFINLAISLEAWNAGRFDVNQAMLYALRWPEMLDGYEIGFGN